MRYLIAVALALVVGYVSVHAADEDTPAAARTRKLLKKKVTVDFQDTPLKDVVDELKDQVKGLLIQIDTKGGVSQNRSLTYKAEDKPLDEVLDGLFKKAGLGYYVISGKNNAYDGSIRIVAGKQRGYPDK